MFRSCLRFIPGYLRVPIYRIRNQPSCSITNAMASHLTETIHVIDKEQAFTIICRVPLNRSRLVRSRLISIEEAIGIRLLAPQLCTHKKLVRHLKLKWPVKNPVPQAFLTLTSLTRFRDPLTYPPFKPPSFDFHSSKVYVFPILIFFT
ncbi:hypothetical protein CSKR_107842 [Clonorchis sinensis]|uniref:Uncharacterized protein n=1 Tax=Clonorchis sinensis TaxID=79923 RepID=A0A3R7GTB9_CLOSI|nr:hypothetical protein CSKR_107842 [Clonorchis sinensis]